MASQKHIWNFSTIGGVKRVNLESGEDLKHLDELDLKLWTVLGCPTAGLEIDKKTLDLIDLDKDGQLRVPEIIAATKWLTSMLKNADDILKQEKTLPLAAIDTSTEEGKLLLSSAKIILNNLGKGDSLTISAEDTSNTEKVFAASKFNGDGIITEDTVDDLEILKLIEDIISCVGSEKDYGGKEGISLAIAQQFHLSCNSYLARQAKLATNPTFEKYGVNTKEAFDSFQKVKAKIDDYFLRCRLAAFQPEATASLNLSNDKILEISHQNLSNSLVEIAEYPLSKIEPGKTLQLDSGINPAWESEIAKFKSIVVAKLFNSSNTISETDWQEIITTFAAYLEWELEKAGTEVEKLGLNRIQEIISTNQLEKIFELIEKDKALEKEALSIITVDKLVRLYCDLFTLLKNFVSFYDFYSRGYKAIFQAGTLYIDQRSCDLCIKVVDMPKHNAMVSFSGMYLMYCECTSIANNESMTIVAAVTNGDIDNLSVGRNAIFYDRNGLDWNATVVKIIDNPISIRQAFFSPYRKVSRFIETQLNKAAAEQDNKVHVDATKNIESAQTKLVEAPVVPKPPAPPFDIGKFVGIFAAISLALGAIGTIIASVLAGFLALVWWKMPLAFAGIILLISGPSMIMAYLKLRQRNLAPILDANGWAINARAIVNIQFGNLLTHLIELPAGSKINLIDPFSKKKRPILPFAIALGLLISLLLYLLWRNGLIHINI